MMCDTQGLPSVSAVGSLWGRAEQSYLRVAEHAHTSRAAEVYDFAAATQGSAGTLGGAAATRRGPELRDT